MLSSTTDPLPSSASAASVTGRQLIVVRHGERCDFVFNRQGAPSWVARAFDSNGKYKPFDVNLPRSLPKRSDGIEQFEHDTPLTEMGYLQAKLLGRAMRDRGIRIDVVYSSHSLRCVQTAVGILKGVGAPSTMSICIEPGLFEWMQWCRGTKPSAMSRYELAKNGYPVNMQYVEMVRDSELQLDETLEQYYHRSDSVIRAFLRQQTGPGTILVVAHSGSLEACTRLLCGGPARSSQDFYYILRNTPFLAATRVVEEKAGSSTAWRHAGTPALPLTHGANSAHDASLLAMESGQLRDHAERQRRMAP